MSKMSQGQREIEAIILLTIYLRTKDAFCHTVKNYKIFKNYRLAKTKTKNHIILCIEYVNAGY